MSFPSRVAAALLTASLVACAETPPKPAPAAQVASRDPRLVDDVGGWTPSAELLDAAAKLGDATSKKDALPALDAGTAAHRIDVLRAGLRLRDAAAAKACAARLTWQQIDRWECARCVDLLIDDVLKPGTEADFEEFRSYLGSVELTRFLRALPPTPWKRDPAGAIAQTHRIARAEHIPVYLELTRHPDKAVADEAWAEIGLLGRWNDEFREEVDRREVEKAGKSVPDSGDATSAGLSPVLAAWLRATYLDPGPEVVNDNSYLVWNADIRWCWESTPGPRDAELLMALAQRGSVDWTRVAGVAYALLGKLHDPATEAFLREKATDTDEHSPEQLAIWALARRGDPAMLERLVNDARTDTGFDSYALALLMEIAPGRARALLDELLLGPDDEAADYALRFLDGFATPGAFFEPCGYDWRRTSFEGFERAAVVAKLSAMRIARIGVVVPGCRTRAVAVAAARTLQPGDLGEDLEIAAFLETAAPAEFAAALRRVRAAGGGDAALAAERLVRMGDADAIAATLAGPSPPLGFDFISIARTAAAARTSVPKLRKRLEDDVRAGIASDSSGDTFIQEVTALALLNGLPIDAWGSFDVVPKAAGRAVLDGRPIDGLVEVLAAAPDAEHGDVGALDDPRVRAYLVRLRERRDLGHYWYATGQLAAMGDAAARAEFWGAMQDGRYRIVNEANFFDRTLGWDLPRTMPFWIDELRSQCCRIVTGGGDIVEGTLGIDCFQSPWRTAYKRAKEVWDSAGGRFVRSRIAGHWVPAPR